MPVPRHAGDRQKEGQVQFVLYFDWPFHRPIQNQFDAERQPQTAKHPKGQGDRHRLKRLRRIFGWRRRLLYDIDIRDLARQERLIEFCLLQSGLGISVIGFEQVFLSLQLCNFGFGILYFRRFSQDHLQLRMQCVCLCLKRRDAVSLNRWIKRWDSLAHRHREGRRRIGFGQLRIVLFQFPRLQFEVRDSFANFFDVWTFPRELRQQIRLGLSQRVQFSSHVSILVRFFQRDLGPAGTIRCFLLCFFRCRALKFQQASPVSGQFGFRSEQVFANFGDLIDVRFVSGIQ